MSRHVLLQTNIVPLFHISPFSLEEFQESLSSSESLVEELKCSKGEFTEWTCFENKSGNHILIEYEYILLSSIWKSDNCV